MPQAIPAVVAVGGAALAARGGKKAAGEASEAQLAGTLAGVEEQRRQFDISRQQLAPFRQAGLSALQQQLALLGLPGLQPEQFGPQLGAGQAGQAPVGPGGEQLFRRVQAARGQSRFRPVPGAPEAQGIAFPEAVSREDALAAFAETPGQQFLRERQERSLLRSASATGQLGGGNVRTALQEQAFGRAATQLGEFQNRLAALSGGGQTATTNVASLGAGAAGQISQGLQAGGAARASGILGGQQATAAGIQGIAGALGGLFGGGPGASFSDIRLKTNIKKIGKFNNYLNLYSWIWNEEGEKLAGDQPTVGVLAQEVLKTFPNAVIESSDGFLMVNYSEIH